MPGKVFFSLSMSLDGYVAPVHEPYSPPWMAQWTELQQWVVATRFFRSNVGFGDDGDEGPDNDIARATYERTGVTVMGKRMFDLGEEPWGDEPPFHTPVFVVTHEQREPLERVGTTFHFVNDGIESALEQAKAVAGERDIRIGGGGTTVLEYLNAGLIDEFTLALSPVVFGAGTRLFEGVDADRVKLEQVNAQPTPRATHVTYVVHPR